MLERKVLIIPIIIGALGLVIKRNLEIINFKNACWEQQEY